MKVKVGDTVTVLAGSDKGKTGKVTKILKSKNRVIVEGVHVVTRHIKPGRMNETGGIVKIEAPIDASNVKVAKSQPKKEVTKAAKEVKEEKVVKASKPKTTTKTATKKKQTKKESEK